MSDLVIGRITFGPEPRVSIPSKELTDLAKAVIREKPKRDKEDIDEWAKKLGKRLAEVDFGEYE